ncbi:MAG: hypothetical protein GQ477_01235 [Nanohaloarchaea archaeon]|nr:hypothetical protein [Candidatus Nanohaloarchaea archaeon]
MNEKEIHFMKNMAMQSGNTRELLRLSKIMRLHGFGDMDSDVAEKVTSF